MFSEKKEKQLSDLTPAALEEKRKQRSLNRIFGLLVGIAVILFGMFIYELIVLLILNK